MAKRISVQLARLKEPNDNAFIFIDEPGLQFIFSALPGYGEQKVKTDLDNFFAEVDRPRGIHLCGNSDWATMGLITGDEFPEDIKKHAFEPGCRLVKAWKTKTVDSEVKTKKDDFNQRMRSLMTWRKAEWPFEYNYWVTHHGL